MTEKKRISVCILDGGRLMGNGLLIYSRTCSYRRDSTPPTPGENVVFAWECITEVRGSKGYAIQPKQATIWRTLIIDSHHMINVAGVLSEARCILHIIFLWTNVPLCRFKASPTISLTVLT